MSALNTDEKGSIVSFDLNNGTKNEILTNKDISITCDISKDGSQIVYADALTDSDSWQIYSYNLNNKSTTKVITDRYCKVHAKIADNNSIYAAIYHFFNGSCCDHKFFYVACPFSREELFL